MNRSLSYDCAIATSRPLLGLLLTFLTVLLAACGGGSEADPEPPAPASINGTATVAGQPVSAGRVTLLSTDGVPLAETTTDGAGRYTVTRPADAPSDGMWLSVSGGQVLGGDLQGTLRAFHSVASAGPANVTAVTSLLALLADAGAESTPQARHDAALARMIALGAVDLTDWAATEPSTVDTAALRSQLAGDGIQDWLQAATAALGTSSELGAGMVEAFPRVHGGILRLSLDGSDPIPMLRGFESAVRIGVQAHVPIADYEFRITRGPAGATLSSEGVLKYLPAETGAAVTETVEIAVTRRSSGLGRTVAASIDVLPVETVLFGEIGAEGGTLANNSQDTVLTVPAGAVPAGTLLRVVRARSASGVETYALKSSAGMTLPASLKAPAATPVDQLSQPASGSSSSAGRKRALTGDGATMVKRRSWTGNYLKFNDGSAAINRYNRLKSGGDCRLWHPVPGAGSVTCDGLRITSELHSYCSAYSCSGKVPVIFVHGFLASGATTNFPELGGGSDTWGSFREDLMEEGYAVYEFRWRTNANFKDIAAHLEAAVKIARADTGQPVHLLTHSFGGLVARTYLQGHAGYGAVPYTPGDVRSLITIGTPHLGIADKKQTLHNVELPKGQDALAFEGCLQISCHMAGEETAGSFRENGFSFAEDFGISEERGEIPALLSKSAQSFPVNVLALYSLQANFDAKLIGPGLFFTEGDGLISFAGQRFLLESWESPTTANDVILEISRNSLSEVILGNEHGTLPGQRVTATSKASIAHSCGTYLWGCGSSRRAQPFIDNEEHPSLVHVIDWLSAAPPPPAAPAPAVSSINPTSMVANNTEQTLTINGSNFGSGNVVQYRYGVGAGSGVWTTSPRTPTITATRITIQTNPGTVADTINWRVCRSSSANAAADCSSGTHAVTVTPAAAPAPAVSSINPTSMVANNTEQTLTINGSNFGSGNVVQYRYGVGSGSGVWTTSPRTPTITATRITIQTNPGTVADTINWRVCRSSSATAAADCSSGTHAVTVTAVATTAPDLVAQGVVFDPGTVTVGGMTLVTFSVTNTGAGASAGSQAAIRIAPAAAIDPGNADLSSVTIPGLSAGASVTRTVGVNVPTTDGEYKVWVVADASNTAGQSAAAKANDAAGAPLPLTVVPRVTPLGGTAEGAYGGRVTGYGAATAFRLLILENGEFWALYGRPIGGRFTVYGFMQGTSSSASGSLSSTDLRDFGFAPSVPGSATGIYDATEGTISGSLTTSRGTATLTGGVLTDVAYEYDQAARLADVQGLWGMLTNTGDRGGIDIQSNGHFETTTTGGCSLSGDFAPRASGKNVFDVVVSFGGWPCALPGQTTRGIAVVNTESDGRRQLTIGTVNATRSVGLTAAGYQD